MNHNADFENNNTPPANGEEHIHIVFVCVCVCVLYGFFSLVLLLLWLSKRVEKIESILYILYAS